MSRNPRPYRSRKTRPELASSPSHCAAVSEENSIRQGGAGLAGTLYSSLMVSL